MPDPMSSQPRTPLLSMGIGPPSLRGGRGLVAEAAARQWRRLEMRRSRRARVLHGHADAAVANTPVRLNDAGRVTRGRAASLQRLVEGGFAALDRSAHDAEEDGGVDRRLGLLGPGGADEAQRAERAERAKYGGQSKTADLSPEP